jgi:hypothetical protein
MYVTAVVRLGPSLTDASGVGYYLSWQNITMAVQVLLTHGLYPWFAYLFVIDQSALKVILAHRLYAMYERSRKVLIFLVCISHFNVNTVVNFCSPVNDQIVVIFTEGLYLFMLKIVGAFGLFADSVIRKSMLDFFLCSTW